MEATSETTKKTPSRTMMFSILIAVIMLITLVIWSVFFTEPPAIKEAKAEVSKQLFDPDAAKFRDVKADEKGKTVCGEVNAKNRYGAYVGFKRFVASRLLTDRWMIGFESEDAKDNVIFSHFSSKCP